MHWTFSPNLSTLQNERAEPMIWSLIKIVLFVVVVAALTLGAGFLIEAGGEVRIAIGAMEFSLTPLAGMIGLLVILACGWVIFRLTGLLIAVFRFFNGDETAISRYFDRNRERRGFEALADGLMALASGEGKAAMAKAARAEKYLQRPELTVLLSAQAAEMSGETAKAQGYYKKLLSDERTRFVGVHGILKQKLAEGDTDTALKLAEKAFALRPRHEKTMDTLFALQSGKSDWSGARKTLEAKLKAKALPKDVHIRRDAVLALAEAREKIEAGDIEAGRLAALHANRLSPDLIPAAALAAEMQSLDNNPKAAVKLLKKAWTAAPHPDLAAAFADIAPDETAEDRLQRFQPLLKINPDHSETRLLAAELSIVAEDYPTARKAIGDLVEDEPTTRSLTIMAAIERGEGAPDNVVRGWLTKALGAQRGPQWICGSCKHIHANWVPTCENCAGFDTLVWELPPETGQAMNRSADMLPLIVGALEDRREPDADSKSDTVEDATIVQETAHEIKPEPSKPKRDLASRMAEESDDLDGILGDVHVIPETEKT
jgi:HemY protein